MRRAVVVGLALALALSVPTRAAAVYLPSEPQFLDEDEPVNPDTFNRFAYAHDNPLRYWDPSGNNALLVVAAVAVGVAFIVGFESDEQANLAPFAPAPALLAAGAGLAINAEIQRAGLEASGDQNPAVLVEMDRLRGERDEALGYAVVGAFGTALSAIPVAKVPRGTLAPPGAVARVAELKAAIPAQQQGRITMAVGVAEDAAGVRTVLVGTSEPRGYLRPGVTLAPGETPAPGPGHAEADLVRFASEKGLTLKEVGATRPICKPCEDAIRAAGAEPVTPLKGRK